MKTILTTILVLGAGLTNAQTVDNWVASGQPVRNSTGLCWRDASWAPATAHPDCDGAIKPVIASAPKPTQVDITKPTATIAARAPVIAEVKKITYGADALFDFDKAVIKPEGKVMLTNLAKSMSSVVVEVVIAAGHTDNVGTDKYNMKLGQRRAEAVRAFLISHGIEKTRIYTESKGESQPVADNKTAAGRAKNRRVEVEVIGTVKN